MDSEVKNRACHAILAMAVFLLPAAGAVEEQGPQRRDALFEFELRDHTHEHWLEEFFHTELYGEVSPGSVPSSLTAALGPTPGDTLLPENATYHPAPTDLILPDERLTDEAFRNELLRYLPSFGENRPEQFVYEWDQGSPLKYQYVGFWWGVNGEGRDGNINAAHAYARGLSGRGVRIGIVDTGVDILHSEFAGRVQRTGSFLTRKIPYTFGPQDLAEAFSACSNEAANCRVFEIDASGDRALIEHYAHRIIEAERRFPDEYYAWFIRDLSRGADGWHAIPGLYREELGSERPDHGTGVASVAAGWRYGIAPGATIGSLLVGEFESLHFWESAHRAGDDASKARAYRDFLSHFDIINYSVGSTDYDLQVSGEDWYRRNLPALWAALTQRDAQEKTIIVWAADNHSLDRPSPAASLPAREPAVRGHHLAVVAVRHEPVFVGDGGTALTLADPSNRCGALPGDWNPLAHGRHYCLAAPGELLVAKTNALPPPPGAGGASRDRGEFKGYGTSLSAPLVSGAIALVMERFRGQLSNREVALRVVNTANNRGRFSDSHIYGAGLLDLDAATAPVGEVSTGTAAMQAGLHRTRLATPPAWGRVGRHLAGREVAGFDEWNAPFWQPAASLFATSPAPQALLPMPGWDEGFEQRALLSHLRWFGASGEGREDGLRMTLWGDDIPAAGFRGGFPWARFCRGDGLSRLRFLRGGDGAVAPRRHCGDADQPRGPASRGPSARRRIPSWRGWRGNTPGRCRSLPGWRCIWIIWWRRVSQITRAAPCSTPLVRCTRRRLWPWSIAGRRRARGCPSASPCGLRAGAGRCGTPWGATGRGTGAMRRRGSPCGLRPARCGFSCATTGPCSRANWLLSSVTPTMPIMFPGNIGPRRVWVIV